MADRARCDLPYGHFGRGIYCLADHCWHFERAPTSSPTTHLLEEPRVLSGALNLPVDTNHGAVQRAPPSKRHKLQLKALADFSPTLRPAVHLLSPLLRVSEAVQDALRAHDPLKGRQLALGEIQSYSRHRPIPVVAYVTGITGCKLCINQVQKQKRGWDADHRSWLEVPTLHGEQITWSSQGGPIQQIQIASNFRPGAALLAVRLLTRTTIIRAVHVKTPSEEARGSGISINILYNVEVAQTGGYAHVDVAFNPWFPQQVALIDIAGKWSVLEFSARDMSSISRRWSERAQKMASESGLSSSDGWARVAWVLNPGTLAVCTRETLTLFSIADEDPNVIEQVELGLSGVVPWVLDFLVPPGLIDHLCVLTSTHILVYSLDETTAPKRMANVKFRIRHYRNPEDLSLRLSAWVEDDPKGKAKSRSCNMVEPLIQIDIGVLLYSRRPGPTACYRFTLSDARSTVTVHHMDAPLSRPTTSGDGPDSIVAIEIERIAIAHKPGEQAHNRQFRDARFFSALVAREDLGVYQTLFCTGIDAAPPPFAWTAKLATSSFRLSRSQFVIDDSSLDVEASTLQRFEPSARRLRPAKLRPEPSQRTINLEQVADLLQSPIGSTELFADVLSTIAAKLEQPHMDNAASMRTLYSFTHAELDVGDMEQCATAFASLLRISSGQREGSPGFTHDTDEYGQRLTLARIETPPSLGLENLHLDADLSSIYDSTLAMWTTPLPQSIPGRIRVAKANLCARVAAQVALSSHTLGIESPPEIQESLEHTQGQSQSQSQSLYRRENSQAPDQQLEGYTGIASSQLESSQPFPSSALPTPSQTPSVTTGSSYPSVYTAPEPHRLSKYTTFSKPPPPLLPRSLQNVLSHWKEDQDINDYDWMSTSRRIAHQNEDADDEMTEAERRRAQRRAERHLRRQRKEAAASQAQQIASSQAPVVLSASQPTGLRVGSQAPGPGLKAAAASQVEAGRFGGRPALAGGKKRRRQGF